MKEKSRYMGGVGQSLISVPAPEQVDAVPENETESVGSDVAASIDYLRAKGANPEAHMPRKPWK